MENNNPLASQPSMPATPATPVPVAPAPVQAPVPTATTPVPSGGSNKIALFFVLGLVIILILVGGGYYVMSKQNNAANTPAPTTQPVMASATPKPEELINALDKDLEAVNADSSTDFSSVDQDLQNL